MTVPDRRLYAPRTHVTFKKTVIFSQILNLEKKDDDTRRISRQDRTRSSIRSSRRARSASITRSTVKLSDNPSTTQNAIVITRERREKRNFKNDLQKDVSDDSALSPDITDSDTRNQPVIDMTLNESQDLEENASFTRSLMSETKQTSVNI